MNCPLLETISLSGGNVTDDGFVLVLKHCPNLSEIEIIDCSLTDLTLRNVATYCSKHISRLYLTTELTDEGIIQVVTSCLELKHISFTEMEISNAVLYAIAKANTLDSLYMNNWFEITSNGIWSLQQMVFQKVLKHLTICGERVFVNTFRHLTSFPRGFVQTKNESCHHLSRLYYGQLSLYLDF